MILNICSLIFISKAENSASGRIKSRESSKKRTKIYGYNIMILTKDTSNPNKQINKGNC